MTERDILITGTFYVGLLNECEGQFLRTLKKKIQEGFKCDVVGSLKIWHTSFCSFSSPFKVSQCERMQASDSDCLISENCGLMSVDKRLGELSGFYGDGN